MYDAYAGAKGNMGTINLSPYLTGLPSAQPGSSPSAAVAAAAHRTLNALYPAQAARLDAAYASADVGTTGVGDGRSFGLQVADAILALRASDPDASAAGYAYDNSPGRHRSDPANPQPSPHAPYYGAQSNCFAVTTRHVLKAPPALNEPAYLAALDQVRAKGIAPELAGTVPLADQRTTDETLVGIFWAYDGARLLGTPPRLYNQIVRRLAEAAGTTEEQNARLFALVQAAMGDAGILAWEQKYEHDFWRPVIGVREHDPSMGPGAPTSSNPIVSRCDTQWLPLGAPKSNETGAKNFTPPFPAYPSGHATFGAAALEITRHFFHHDLGMDADALAATLEFVSDECNGITSDVEGVVRPRHSRVFPGGLRQMMIENGASRVFLGVHWVFDAYALDSTGQPDLAQFDIGGVPLGMRIADDIHASALKVSTV